MDVVHGWKVVRDLLLVEGRDQLAEKVARFVNQMLPPQTEKAGLAQELIELARQSGFNDKPLVR